MGGAGVRNGDHPPVRGSPRRDDGGGAAASRAVATHAAGAPAGSARRVYRDRAGSAAVVERGRTTLLGAGSVLSTRDGRPRGRRGRGQDGKGGGGNPGGERRLSHVGEGPRSRRPDAQRRVARPARGEPARRTGGPPPRPPPGGRPAARCP